MRLRGKSGWREVEIDRGSTDATCPHVALETWLSFARIAHGPLFRRVTGLGKTVGVERLQDHEIARRVKKRLWLRVCVVICQKSNADYISRAIPCVPASPPRQTSMNAMCKNNLAMHPLK